MHAMRMRNKPFIKNGKIRDVHGYAKEEVFKRIGIEYEGTLDSEVDVADGGVVYVFDKNTGAAVFTVFVNNGIIYVNVDIKNNTDGK